MRSEKQLELWYQDLEPERQSRMLSAYIKESQTYKPHEHLCRQEYLNTAIDMMRRIRGAKPSNV